MPVADIFSMFITNHFGLLYISLSELKWGKSQGLAMVINFIDYKL